MNEDRTRLRARLATETYLMVPLGFSDFSHRPAPGGILFSTIYLGQHYLVDLLAGTAYAIVPSLIAERL